MSKSKDMGVIKLRILKTTMALLKKDESGKKAVEFLKSKKMGKQELYRYFKEAEFRVWIEPWENIISRPGRKHGRGR